MLKEPENEWEHVDPLPKAKRVLMSDSLVKRGIVSREGDATVLLILAVLFSIMGTIYFLTAGLPKEQKPLGHDILRAGEVVPKYVH